MEMEAAALSTQFILIYKTTQHHAKSEVPTVIMLRLVGLLGATQYHAKSEVPIVIMLRLVGLLGATIA